MRLARCLPLLGMLAACGRIGFGSLASDGDGGSGLGDGSALPTTVDLVTVDRGRTNAGAVVWTNRVSGEIDDVGVSDALGHATLHLESGGTASAAFPAVDFGQGPTATIESVTAVEPGDTLSFAPLALSCVASGSQGQATLTWTARGVDNSVHTACDALAPSSPTTLTWTVPVDLPEPSDVVVVALDAGSNEIATAAWLDATVGASSAHTFTSGDWQPVVAGTSGYSGVPAGTTDGVVVQTVITQLGTVVDLQLIPGVPVTAGTVSAPIDDPGLPARFVQLGQFNGALGLPFIGVERESTGPQVFALASPPPAVQLTPNAARTGGDWIVTTPGVGNAIELVADYAMAGGDSAFWIMHAPNDGRTALELPVAPPSLPAMTSNGVLELLIVQYNDFATWDQIRVLDPLVGVFGGATSVIGLVPHVASLDFAAAAGSLLAPREVPAGPRRFPSLPFGVRPAAP